MQREWLRLSLAEAGIQLLDCEHRTPPAMQTGFPYIAIPQMKDGRIRLAGVRRISDADFEKWTRKTCPQANDIILSRRCNPGESAVVPKGLRCALGQNLVLLRTNSQLVLPEFLRWLVRGPEWWEQVRVKMNSGVLFESLKCADIPQFRLTIPPKSVQRGVSTILSSLDDKIELNRRMNVTLEEMARALFDRWYSKAENGAPPPSVQQLSDLEVLAINDGYRAKRSELGTDGLPFVRAGNLYDDGVRVEGAEILSSASVALVGHKIAQPNDIAFTSKGTVGRMTFVTHHVPQFVYSPQVCFWRVLDPTKMDPHVLYRWMQSDEFTDQVDMVKGQTDMADYVSLRDQRRMRVTLPPFEKQRTIAPMLARIDETIGENASQSQTLTNLRDSLLPRLLSGEIRLGRGAADVKEIAND